MSKKRPSSWIDRTAMAIAPQWHLQRMRARFAADMLARHYEAASSGRRTQNWRRASTDANAALSGQGGRLRDIARDLVRNNPYAESAVDVIAEHTVGWGIHPSVENELWNAWAMTTACDADGQCDFPGLTELVMRTVVESGECLVRRRIRATSDLPLAMQLQILEPDYIDTTRTTGGFNQFGRQVIQGVEFDRIGQRTGYWLFRDHPGSETGGTATSVFVPAESVLHIFRKRRPGQVRGASWFAPVLLRMKDFDEYEDATLMKQKIAACLAVLVFDADGSGSPLGTGEINDIVDTLEPGMIRTMPVGQNIETVTPPTTREYPDYAKNQLRAIATGLGVTYEDLTGDYTNMPFSAARMSRLRHWSKVEGWRWRMLVPQFLNPVWKWVVQVAGIQGVQLPAVTEWNAPPLPMIEPDKEGLAIMRNVRAGIQTLRQAIRERGWNYDRFLDELEADFKELDRRKLVLDIDPRRMTQTGQAQQQTNPADPAEGDDE